MKIILLKDIKKQGKKGDILTVKDGYGQFLINNNEAIMATSSNLKIQEHENEKKEHEEELLIKECNQIKSKIESTTLTFKVKTGAQDKVFGSVSAKQICEELKKIGINIDKKQISIDNPIDTLGVHEIELKLHKKVTAKVKVHLVK